MQCAVFIFSLPTVSPVSFSRCLGCLWYYQAVEFPFTKSFTVGKFFLFTPLRQCAMTWNFTFKDFPLQPQVPLIASFVWVPEIWKATYCTASVPAAAWDQTGSSASPAHPASCHVYPPVTEIILCFPEWIGCDRTVTRSELNVCELILSELE